MSTQTGIRPNEELHRFFASCRDETTTGREKFRLIKVSIENEQLVLADAKEAAGDWRADWARQVPSSVERGQPCYLLFRTDSKDDGGAFGWTLISWSPDDASVRDKMLYASTKATLRKEFGGGQIRDELHGTSGEEVNLDGYLRHLESAGAPGPRSSDEVERDEARLDWTSSTVAVDSKVCSMSGLAFPLADAALAALDRFRAGDVDYLQLAIDLDKEIVVLSRDHQGSCPASDLAQMVPADAPRYHLFRFKHSHEGDYMESNGSCAGSLIRAFFRLNPDIRCFSI